MFKKKLIIFIAIHILIFLSGCSSVSTIEPGRFAISCSSFKSDESCASEIAESCPSGYRIVNTDSSWSFGTGYMSKKVFVACKDKNLPPKEKGIISKLKGQGYTLSKKDNVVFAEKEGKVFKLTESKYLCSETNVDLAAAEAKGYTISENQDESFLVKGERKILLSRDKKHLCKRI